MDERKVITSFEKHKAEPNISIDEYVRTKRIELGKRVTRSKLIYLDKKYWIILRDVTLGRRTDLDSVLLLDSLRRKAAENKLICPISESIFLELLKQDDLHTRRETARLIDELSFGITLSPEQERIETEISHFLYSTNDKLSTDPLKWLVWSKLSYVLGIVHPTNTGFEPELEPILQKSFFDYMWDFSLTGMIELLGNTTHPILNFEDLAERLNTSIAMHADVIRSFDQVYMHEIQGVLSLHMSIACSALGSMIESTEGIAFKLTKTKQTDIENQFFGLFSQVFKKPELRKRLPTIHVHALCHAAVRWDKKRRLEGNDLYDFHHAAAAVPYCDFFLTEKPLRSLLQSNHLKIKDDFSCKVISSIIEAAECIEAI